MRALRLAALVLLACGGDAEVRTRSVSNNDQCVSPDPGGAPGDACDSPDDCSLIACCMCPNGVRNFSAAACNGECLSAEETCAAAFDSPAPRCE